MTNLSHIWRVQDKIDLGAAFVLFISPWALQFTDIPYAAWNAWLCGAAVAIIAFAALFALKRWEEWHGILLGAWLVVAPWVLEFSALMEAAGIHIAAGAVLIISAAWEIWDLRHSDPAAETE